jgi:hypothetical protein
MPSMLLWRGRYSRSKRHCLQEHPNRRNAKRSLLKSSFLNAYSRMVHDIRPSCISFIQTALALALKQQITFEGHRSTTFSPNKTMDEEEPKPVLRKRMQASLIPSITSYGRTPYGSCPSSSFVSVHQTGDHLYNRSYLLRKR